MSKKSNNAQESLESSSPSSLPKIPEPPTVTRSDKPATAYKSQYKEKKTNSTPQTSSSRPARTTPTTVGPRPPSVRNSRATARKLEYQSRVSDSNSSGTLVFQLSRDASKMSAEEIVQETGDQIKLADSTENIFNSEGGTTSLFDAAPKKKKIKKKHSNKRALEGSVEGKSKKKKKKGSNKWLEKNPGETPEKLYSSSPSTLAKTVGETPTKSTSRGDEAKWMDPPETPSKSSEPDLFQRAQDSTPTKAPQKSKKGKEIEELATFPLPDGWWNILKMTNTQRDLYVKLFNDSEGMVEENRYRLWNTALDIIYLVGEEQGAWGDDPKWEEKLSAWRAEMIFKHDLTILPPISWNPHQRSIAERPTDAERRIYTDNFHKMFNNTYWRIPNQTWEKECLDRCRESNDIVLQLRGKYMDFPWYCLPLPSNKWQNHPSQYIPKPPRQYSQWAVRVVDFGLMNFGDAEEVRIPNFQSREREGSFEYYFHKAWLETAERYPPGTLIDSSDDGYGDESIESPLDEGTVDPIEGESDEDEYILGTPVSSSPEPAPEIVDDYYDEDGDEDEDDGDLEEEEPNIAKGDQEQGLEGVKEQGLEGNENGKENRQVGMKSKRVEGTPTSAGKRSKVSS